MTTERMLGGFTRKEWLFFLGVANADDPKLAALAGATWGGNALKFLQVNATENGWQFSAIIGLTDGDKGDITVSSSGATWTIDNGAVTNAKRADMAQATISGRASGAGTGAPTDLSAAQVLTILGGTTGSGALALAGSPTFTGTMAAAAASFSGNVTLGDTTGDAHTLNGSLTLKGDASSQAIIYNLGATIRHVDVSSGGTIYYDLGFGGAAHGSFIWRSSNSAAQVMQLSNSGLAPISTTTASAANVHQASSGSVLLRSTSSRRYKRDIEDIDPAYSAAILKLRPVWFRSRSPHDDPEWGFWGFIAEEAAKIDPRLVHWIHPRSHYRRVTWTETATVPTKRLRKDGSPVMARVRRKRSRLELREGVRPTVPDGFQYDRLTVLLLDLVKRQERRIAALEAIVEARP